MPPSANGLLAPNLATFISVHPNLRSVIRYHDGNGHEKVPYKYLSVL